MKQNKAVDLVSSDASEEDKLKVMMSQAGEDWQPTQYVRGRGRGYNPSGPLPPNYVCYRCGKPGHFIRNCPTNGVKRSIGIPRTFGDDADSGTTDDASKDTKKDPSEPTKKLVPVPEIDTSKKDRKVPSELKCPMCQNLLTDAVLIPCCGTSYCDECIRTYLLENEQECPTCGADDVSPDSLIINKQLRQAVNNFRNARPASPFVNSTTDKTTASSSADKPAPSSTVDKPAISNADEDKPVTNTSVPDSKPQSDNTVTSDVKCPDSRDKEKSDQKVLSTTSEIPQKEISEVREEEIKKKEGSPLAFKADVSSPRRDQFSDNRPPPREHHRTGPRPAGPHSGQHPGHIPGYGHHEHPIHRGPPHGPSHGHPMAEPIIHHNIPPEGALLVPPMRTIRPLLPQPGPLMPQPGFMGSAQMGLHPIVRHPNMVRQPNILGAPMAFGMNPSGFHSFDNRMHVESGLPPMSEEEFYRYQRKMIKIKTKRKHREKEKVSRKERTSNRGQPGNFDDELSQYRALQKHRTKPHSRSRSYSRSRSRSHSNSRSFSRSLSHSSRSVSKSPTPEDWDRSRTPSPLPFPEKSGSKSPMQSDEKKTKHRKRKKHHKRKHSKKQKTTETEDSETKSKVKTEKGQTEKVEKKKSKSKKRSKDKDKHSKSKEKAVQETNDTTQKVNSEESVNELNAGENSEKEPSTEEVPCESDEVSSKTEVKLGIQNIEKQDKEKENGSIVEVNESEKSRKRKSEEMKSEDDGTKRKSKDKSGEKKHKKKKHKKKHKRHKKEKGKTSSQSAEGNNESTEETQEDSEDEIKKKKEESIKC